MKPRPNGSKGFPIRAILTGFALLPVNAFWLVQMEMATQQSRGSGGNAGPFPSTFSLFANAVCLLTALLALNVILKRTRRSWAFSQSELLLIYVMLTVGTCITSVDFLDVLFGMLAHPARYATASNRWLDLFGKHIPPWFQVINHNAVQAWYAGRADPYKHEFVMAWIAPLLAWGTFIFAVLFVMLCINILLRRPLTQHEKLSFPIIQLPLHMTDEPGVFFRDRRLWAGFGIAGGICLLNGLSYLFPSLPTVPVKIFDISPFFPNKPWNAIGWTPISFYPFAIGMGFLLPTDLLFSCWFFFLFWKVERVLCSSFGWSDNIPDFPYVNEQSYGAYLAIALIAIYGLRRYIADVFTKAWRNEGDGDEKTLLSYRNALLGATAGILFTIAFFHAAGLPVWICVLAFAIYFMTAVAVTQMRAELGPPAHDLHHGGPDYLLTAGFGTRSFSPQQLSVLTYFYWFNRAYRSMAMPVQMEAFKIGERRNISPRNVTAAILVAMVGGLISGMWALYHTGYHNGLEARMAPHMAYFGSEAFDRLSSWIQSPRKADGSVGIAVIVGLTITILLQVLRRRFIWWPFHPLGFAVAANWSMHTIWVPLMIAWVCKVCILRYGGLQSYRRALAFFFGLILGDYIIGCAWPIIGWLIGTNTYSFQQ